ncbi:MAG: hypothetical protein E7520_07460 [Ruminococcaceae bacterium]|nr:hypothetical protein [Oscillospiraceae bacterium]
MNEKQIAKRYLISLFALYFAGAVLLGAFTFALSSRPGAATLSGGQIAALAFLLPLLPCASYAGFCTAFLRVKEMSRNQMILMVVLFPLILVGVTVLGVAMLIPNIIKYTVILIRS